MSFRTIAMNCGAGTALALALMPTTTLATPELAAAELPGATYAGAPANDMPLPSAPAAPDMRPEWRPEMRPEMRQEMRPEFRSASTGSALMPDSRTREAWLGECRHRTALYYDNGGNHRRKRHHRDHGRLAGSAPGYDYCEAYFDDYYRTYTQRAYAYPAMMMMQPMTMAPVTTYQTSQPQVSEVVTERYVPIRTRVIRHRRARPVIHDKRIRVAP